MFFEYLVIITCSWFVAQSGKFLFKFYVEDQKKFNFAKMRRTYMYLSGLPSAHSSVLAANTWFLRDKLGHDNPVFLSVGLFSYMWLFEIYMQRKRFYSSTNVFQKLLKKQQELDYLKDLSGHALVDIVAGLLTGSVSYAFLSRYFF